jgi:hypothetical protein
MWTGIIVTAVVLALYVSARVVMSGSVGRLRHGDRPPNRWGHFGGRPGR